MRGLDILKNGSIGLWDDVHSIGQPAGTSYTNALITMLFGPSIWSMRLMHALAGIGAFLFFVRFAYLTLGSNSGALVASAAYALLDSEVLLSRVGFPPIFGQLFINSGLVCLAKGLTAKPDRVWFYMLIAGFLTSISIYFYSATIIAIPALATAPIFLFLRSPTYVTLLYLGYYIFGCCISLLPMILQFGFGTEKIVRLQVIEYPQSITELIKLITLNIEYFFWLAPRDLVDGTGLFPYMLYTTTIFATFGAIATLTFRTKANKAFIIPLLTLALGSILLSALYT
jgi:4-amino-4-deoxy-L-arabinose transferase-like glycosyltransferase